jgi:hypothetical protein
MLSNPWQTSDLTLQILGLPRGAVRRVRVEDAHSRWFGHKDPDCSLLLAGDGMRHMRRVRRRPDSTFRTWVHESLHARQPFSAHAIAEYRAFRGFEEGMVEGLTRHVTRDRAGMSLPDMSYDYYVQAYQTLAPELGIAVEQLWRELWQHPTGAVRSAFGGTVETVYRSTTGQAVTASQRARLRGVADQLFSAARSNDRPDPLPPTQRQHGRALPRPFS